MDLGLRISGSDNWSSDISLASSFTGGYQNWWYNNPTTASAISTTDIGSASGFNIGVKSVT
jgi:hypothetical protein